MQREYTTEWWSVQLPADWSSEEHSECVALFADSGIGALQISAARNNNGPATDDDLRDFAKEHLDAGALIKPVKCGTFTGFYFHYSIDDTYHRQWWLRCDDTVVLTTYTCDLNQKGQEDTVVDDILSTLRKK